MKMMRKSTQLLVKKIKKEPEKEDFPEDPWADKNTGMDPPQKQVTTATAPLNPKDSEQTLDMLNQIADTVSPVHEDNYWRQRREANLFIRLNMAAQRLKEWQQADKEEVLPEGSLEDTQAEGSDSVSSHAQNCHDQTIQAPDGNKASSPQKHLEERPLTIPVEPMTCPPDIIHTIPPSSMQMPPDIPANFLYHS